MFHIKIIFCVKKMKDKTQKKKKNVKPKREKQAFIESLSLCEEHSFIFCRMRKKKLLVFYHNNLKVIYVFPEANHF